MYLHLGYSLLISPHLVDNLYHKSCEEVCGVGEHDCQNEHNDKVENYSEDAGRLDYGLADFFNEGNVALVKIVEVCLEGIGHNRCDDNVTRKEYSHNLHVALGVEIIKSEGNREHEVKHHEIMERNGVEIAEGVEIACYSSIRIYILWHQEHIQHKRCKAGECCGVGNAAELAAVECVQGEKIQKQTAVVEGKSVKIIAAITSCVILFHSLKAEQNNGDCLQGNIAYRFFKFSVIFCCYNRHYEKNQKCYRELIKMSPSPKSHKKSFLSSTDIANRGEFCDILTQDNCIAFMKQNQQKLK